MPIDYDAARDILEATFAEAETNLLAGTVPTAPSYLIENCDVIFRSNTQAYREALLGCVIARIQDRNVNIRLPYVNQGSNSFNGRTLDERAINPFLQDKRIPSSKGPYLSTFRRSVRFDASTREGLRDKEGYDAFLEVIQRLISTSSSTTLASFLIYILYRFALLREAANIQVSRLQRISLEQYESLIAGLLATPSGGRFPMVLAISAFQAVKEFFDLDWEITWQGINVADSASGVGGDITITAGGEIVMAVEVTERPVNRSRVVSTFNTKIAPAGLEDYLFFIGSADVESDARQQARQYFAQGHEVNFVEIKNWILTLLATMGNKGRTAFNRQMIQMLESDEVPSAMKTAWNQQLDRLIAG